LLPEDISNLFLSFFFILFLHFGPDIHHTTSNFNNKKEEDKEKKKENEEKERKNDRGNTHGQYSE